MKAFPSMTGDKGMDLRDYFATAVLQAMLSLKEVHDAMAEDKFTVMDMAGASYQWADAMMEAREK